MQRAAKQHKWTRDVVDQKVNALEQAGILERMGPGLDALVALSEDIEFLGLLAEGGIGRVMLARQWCLERDVAVKPPHPGALMMPTEVC